MITIIICIFYILINKFKNIIGADGYILHKYQVFIVEAIIINFYKLYF